MTKKIKWGIIGLGKIANKFAQDLLLFEKAELCGVASTNMDRAKGFGQKYNAPNYYGSYLELAQNTEIDVIYIATPHTFHFENTMMCLQQGKSVLCEKPLGMNSTEVKTMVAEAKSRNLFLMEALWTQFLPSTERVLELIAGGKIGDVSFIRADFGFKAALNPEGRLFNKKLGGGSLMDIGIYPVYISLQILGIPKVIKTVAQMHKTGVDSFCAMLFDYANGRKAVLKSTFEHNTPTEAVIFGSKGSLKMHSQFHHATKILLTQEDKPEEVYDIAYRGNGYYHEIEEVSHCLIKGKIESNKLPHSFSMNLIVILDQIKEEIGLNY